MKNIDAFIYFFPLFLKKASHFSLASNQQRLYCSYIVIISSVFHKLHLVANRILCHVTFLTLQERQLIEINLNHYSVFLIRILEKWWNQSFLLLLFLRNTDVFLCCIFFWQHFIGTSRGTSKWSQPRVWDPLICSNAVRNADFIYALSFIAPSADDARVQWTAWL